MTPPELADIAARLTAADLGAATDATLGRGALTLDLTLAAPTAHAPVAVPRLESLPQLVVSEPGDDPAGAAVADLEVVGVLGEGGMGLVRLARQVSMQREVAVKTLRAGSEPGAAHALLREGLLAGRLDHPNVVPVHVLGRDAHAQPVIVMKRIEGVAWRELVRDPAHPAWSEHERDVAAQRTRHLEILVQVCRAIEFAHSRGIVHRDLKPDNVMVGPFGEVYVVDWGVAEHLDALSTGAAAGVLVGTPAYIAPEMVAGDPTRVDARADVYLLGATLFEVLTGRAPHEGHDGLMATLYAALQHEHLVVDAAEVGTELAAIVARATARRPEARYASVGALREALADYLRHRGSIELTDGALEALEDLRQRVAEAGAVEVLEEGLRRRLFERFTAAQVGLHGALEVWPENRRARAALQHTLELMIDHALVQRNVELADALLAQLPEACETRSQAVAMLRRSMLAERDASQQLRALRLEHDFGVGRRPRALFLAVFTVIGLAMSSWVLIGEGAGVESLSHAKLLGFISLFVAIYVVAVGLLRARLLRTSVNRRLVGGLGVALVAMALHRLLAWSAGTPPDAVLRQDLFIEAAALGVVAVGLAPRMWLAVLPFVAAAVVAALRPQYTAELFSLVHVVGPTVAVIVLTKRGGGAVPAPPRDLD